MNNSVNIELKRLELYREFRQYMNMTAEEKLAFKTKIAQEASQRTEIEKEEYRQAIKANVFEIKEKLLEIKDKVDKTSKVIL